MIIEIVDRIPRAGYEGSEFERMGSETNRWLQIEFPIFSLLLQFVWGSAIAFYFSFFRRLLSRLIRGGWWRGFTTGIRTWWFFSLKRIGSLEILNSEISWHVIPRWWSYLDIYILINLSVYSIIILRYLIWNDSILIPTLLAIVCISWLILRKLYSNLLISLKSLVLNLDYLASSSLKLS